MGIFSRFGEIISANINALLDKAEDPEKMIDQYLRQAQEDLAEVKKETAGVMAEETRAKRMLDENNAEVAKYMDLAKKALGSGNEGDAKVFLTKKQELEAKGASLQATYDAAHASSTKMRQLHDKLVEDISKLDARRDELKAKLAVAETQKKINQLGGSADSFNTTMGAIGRMEDKVNKMLDTATAAAELDAAPVDDAASLADKYSTASSSSVDDELAALKAAMANDPE